MFIYLTIGYITLYLVIWSHEVGHAFFYYKYGCKSNPFNVTIPLYLAFSTPQPIDLEKEKNLSLKQKFIVGIGGILVNIIFGFVGLIIIKNIEIKHNNFYQFFLYSFVLFNFIEAASYTVINNIYVAGDILEVQNYKPKYRIPLFIIGLVITYIIINLIINSPTAWRFGLIIISVVLAFLMGSSRVIFNIIIKSKKGN